MRDHSKLLKILSITLLFKLLDRFAAERNPYAAVIYKKLTFSLMEEHANIELRDLFLRNFTYIFKKYTTIPVEILMEPLIKQIQMGEG